MPVLTRINRNFPELLPLLLLLLFTVGFFFPVLFLGKAPAMNSMRNMEPWRSVQVERGEGTVEYRLSGEQVYTWETQEGFADDLNRQFIPWGLYCQDRIRSGEWPLWNPHTACGQPMFANHQTGLVNPIILGSYILFPGISAFTAIFFMIFLLSGWGMYAYLRVLGLGRWPALLSAATYQFMLGYIPVLDTLIIEKALFPVLLFSIERLVRAPAGKGAVWAFLSIFLLALVQTTCHVQEAVFISYILGPYIVFAAGDKKSFPKGSVWKSIGKRILLAAGIFIPALVLGLIQNLPTFEFFSLSTRMSGFEEQIVETTELESSLTWIQSLMIMFPRLFGDYLHANMPLEHYLLNYGYVGILTLLAAPLAGWVSATKRQVWFWRIAALIFFVSIIWNYFYFDILCSLPLFRVSLQKPFSPLFFSLIVLAGHGFSFLLEPKPVGSWGNRLMGYVSVFVIGSALSLGVLLLISIIKPDQPFNREQSYVFGQMGIGAGTAALACLATGLYWRAVNKKNIISPQFRQRAVTVISLVLLCIVLLDLWPIKSHFNPFVKREDLYFSTVTTDFLQDNLEWQPGDSDGPYRFARSWKGILPPNTAMVYGLDDFGGYDSNLVGRYAQLLTTVDRSILQGVHFIETPRYRTSFRSDLWNMLGVKYVVAHSGHLAQFEPPERWRHVYNGEVLIMENRDVLPRMILVENVTVVDNPEEALEIAANIDPEFEAVIERDDSSSVDLPVNTGIDNSQTGNVIITEYRPERITADVDCDRVSLLCFFDTWFPGWQVTVDGEPAVLERVNYTFKGVLLSEGSHEVVFSYKPESILYGLLGSLIGLILTLLIIRPLSLLGGKRDAEKS